MKKMLFCLLSLCFGLTAFAQENLLENGGFEDGIPAVVTGQKIHKVNGWLIIKLNEEE